MVSYTLCIFVELVSNTFVLCCLFLHDIQAVRKYQRQLDASNVHTCNLL